MTWAFLTSSTHNPFFSRFRCYIVTIPLTFWLNDFYSMSFLSDFQPVQWVTKNVLTGHKWIKHCVIFLHFKAYTYKQGSGGREGHAATWYCIRCPKLGKNFVCIRPSSRLHEATHHLPNSDPQKHLALGQTCYCGISCWSSAWPVTS